MGININERSQTIIEINGVVHRLAGVHSGRMPGFERLGHQAAHEPIADWLGQEGIALAWRTRRESPVRKWAEFLVASNINAQLLGNIVRVVPRRIEITSAPQP